MLKAGKWNYIDYECSCGYRDGVTARQASKGIICPRCRSKLCGPACVVICPSCRTRTVKRDERVITYFCSCGEKVEA